LKLMPEGPEVRRITDQLTKQTRGGTLEIIDFCDARYTPGGTQMRDEIGSLVIALPVKIEKVACHGKFIYWELDGFVIFQTLGMSGTWRQRKPSKHHRLTFNITKANGKKSALHYKDARCFGTFKIFSGVKAQENLTTKLSKELGPDLLSNRVTEPSEVITRFRKHNSKTLCEVLMNQRVFAGIGNYLKAEILYECKLSPHTKVEDLDDFGILNLYRVCRMHIHAAYAAKGASLQDYVMPDGSKGGQQYRFKVYRRKVCNHCAEVIKQQRTKDKRTTWWCPSCQERPTPSSVQTTLT